MEPFPGDRASDNEDCDSFYSILSEREFFSNMPDLRACGKLSPSSNGNRATGLQFKKSCPMCWKEMAELANKQMSSEERIKDYLNPDPQTQAMLKYAFTKMWVISQQKYTEQKRLPPREGPGCPF